MNIPLWIIAGAALGWIGCEMLNVKQKRGIAAAIALGAVGGFFGGDVVAPLLGAATDTPNDFSAFSLIVAMGTAAGCLVAGYLLRRRHGI
jgi:uncharacterized membrane protein YeaQ/YmgE (transglycosylase-associated protein family)